MAVEIDLLVERGGNVTIVAANSFLLDAVEAGGAALAEALGVAPPASWPPLYNEPEVFDWIRGMMERHPDLKVVMSHTGGALPYQSGRMDKNTAEAGLPRPASHYLRRMYTDTVSPHAAGMKFAIEYYGIDRVMYGTDYPCWDPATALALIDQLGLSPADREKLFYGNARRILGLRDPVGAARSPEAAARAQGISQSAA